MYFWKEKIGQYVMQGDYLALVMEEGSCISWKSYMWDIPQVCSQRWNKHPTKPQQSEEMV